jgi:hypothetical protein
VIGAKDINNKDIPNSGRYNIHPRPMNDKDSEIENENGSDVTPSTKTLRAYG